MTGDAANALVQVNAMIKVGKIWEIIHSGPGNRLPCPKTVPHGGKDGAFRPDIGVTIHTGCGGRHSSKGADLYRGVTIAAVDTKPTRVMLMAELHRLLARYTLFRSIAGPVQCRHEPQQASQHKHRSQDTHT